VHSDSAFHCWRNFGAMYPAFVNQQWYEVVETVNGHDLATIAVELTGFRH
jgi:hypothetical protein